MQIQGHGNFGSQDADPAAAMRYTECRLAPLATDALLADLGGTWPRRGATVDWIKTFDESQVRAGQAGSRQRAIRKQGVLLGKVTRGGG